MPAGAQVTMGFNRARVLEANGSLQAAAREYEGILNAFPGYTDCHLRLACMAVRRGNHSEAVRWAKKALDVKPGLLDAQAMLGEPNSHAPFYGSGLGRQHACRKP